MLTHHSTPTYYFFHFAIKLKFDLNNYCVNTQASGTITLSLFSFCTQSDSMQNEKSERVKETSLLSVKDLMAK